MLSGLIRAEVTSQNIHGVKIARTAPQISHLFFADDSLLFSRANKSEAEKIMSILTRYERASGQVVNLDKSEATFSRNVPSEDIQTICEMMGVKAVEAQSRYLGFPVPFGRSKKVIFTGVMDRVWKKLKGWKERFLSRAGKETLIKAVAQAIPNYILSCYKLPEGCCKDIDSMLAKFWWGSKEEERKIHWMSWAKLSKAKERGGLGFRGFSNFNKALLGKHCWRLSNGDDSLLGKVLKSRYYPRVTFLEAKAGYQPSYRWRSIISAREVVKEGGRWIVGDGKSIRIWKDVWMPSMELITSRGDSCILGEEALVEELVDTTTRQWNRSLIYNVFNQQEALKIVSIPISHSLPRDKICWH